MQGESQRDIRAGLVDFAEYRPTRFADARCAGCGAREFLLETDDEAGVAVRTCGLCGDRHVMGDGLDFIDEADLGEHECTCGNPLLEITIGVSLYEGSEDVRWLYVGCRCPACGLLGCYADWKNEFEGADELLANI